MTVPGDTSSDGATEGAALGSERISVRDLDLFYGHAQALSGVTLDIRTGEITALIGPSGCGKSSFLRCLNRMNDLIPSARIRGQVLLDGEDIYAPRTDVVLLRKRVGMVFQRPNPFAMSVFDNIAYGPRLHGVRRRAQLEPLVEQSLRAAALWDEVKDHLKRSAWDLSGGQQQRLCIARVLAVQPEVILMDEPCSALDPIATLRIEELIAELKERYAIVIVTHNMQQAARVADQVAFMMTSSGCGCGELVEVGPNAQVFTNPQDERTEAYVTGRFG